MKVVTNAFRGAAVVALAGLMLAPGVFADDQPDSKGPVAWGMDSGNSGCVIFKETTRIDSVMAPGGGGFTTQTVKMLEVLDSIHATLPKKKYTETKEDLDTLQQLSVANHWKYVKVPKKASPDDLAKAKTMCGVQ
jgi:hypothetical protein